MATGTYVYCIVQFAPASGRDSTAARPNAPRGLPGAGRPRTLDLGGGLVAVVADAPLARYGEAAINRRLSDLDWVSRAAVAHEAVIASFIDAAAVVPMKLFTIFRDDERAREHFTADRARIRALARRVAKQYEWGVRVLLDRSRAARPVAARATGSSGSAYLARKKAQRDAAVELTARAQDTVNRLYDRLAAKARLARRRAPSELSTGGSLLLDAAFLVPRSRTVSFRASVKRESQRLAGDGYAVALTGPWPPFTFVRD